MHNVDSSQFWLSHFGPKLVVGMGEFFWFVFKIENPISWCCRIFVFTIMWPQLRRCYSGWTQCMSYTLFIKEVEIWIACSLYTGEEMWIDVVWCIKCRKMIALKWWAYGMKGMWVLTMTKMAQKSGIQRVGNARERFIK